MTSRNALKITIVIALDCVLFASLLLGFAWFHHAKPKRYEGMRTFAPQSVNTPVPVEASTPPLNTIDPFFSETPAVDTSDMPTVPPTEAPTPEPTGLLGGKYAEKFTSGEVIYDENGYRSANVCIEMSKHEIKVQYMPVRYCVADIYIKDITSLRCAVSQASNNKEWVVDLANANDAIAAISGDYFLFHRSGLAIRNGELLRDALHPDQDVCVLYRDGTMETYLKGQIDLDYIYSKTPYHAWSFGPRLIENGEAMQNFNTSVENWHPRCAIGYYEPGHYCFVVVDGRQEGYSYGLMMQDLSKLMVELGCKEAYNLDGGMTAMMAYHGELYSQPCGGGRKNCDIVFVAEPLP